MDKLIEGLFKLLFAALIVAAVVAVILLLLSVGALYGAGIAISNYFKAVIKNVKPEPIHVTSPSAGSGDPAIRSYFFGKGYRDLKATIVDSWIANQRFARDIWNQAAKASFVLLRAVHYGAAASCVVYGTAFLGVLSILHSTLLGVVFLTIYALFTALFLIERSYLILKGFLTVCPICHTQVALPVYLCDGCREEHRRLLPSSFGILYHRCRCDRRLPATFFLNRGRLTSKCPSCGHFLSRAHTEARKVFVPVIGGPSTGKTAYLVWLTAELKHHAAAIDQQVDFLNPTEATEFAMRLHAMQSGRMPAKTAATTPIAINLLFTHHSTLHGNLYLYDPAGEAYLGEAELIPHLFLSYCSGILFMIDPFSIPAVQHKYALNRSLADEIRPSLEQPDRLLDRLLFVLEKHFAIDPSASIPVPIAVVLTKVDAVDLEALVGDALLAPALTGHERQITRSFMISQQLREWGLVPLVEVIESRFANKRFFSCSSVGFARAAGSGFTPERISEPFLWLMREAKTGLLAKDLRQAPVAEADAPQSVVLSTNRLPLVSSRSGLWRRLAYVLSAVAVIGCVALAAKLHFEEEALYEEARDHAEKLQNYLVSCIFCWREAQARSEIAAIDQRAEFAQREEAAYRLARGNLELLRNYTNDCQICSFKSDARQEIARIEEDNIIAQQEENTYQMARNDIDRLRAYTNGCRICKFKSEAVDEIQRLAQAKLADEEERAYQAARRNVYGLRSYAEGCRICAYKSRALEEIRELERKELAERESTSYQRARGDIDRLRAYADSCRICAFKSPALAEIRDLEAKANYFAFQVCNSTSHAASIAVVGRKNHEVTGWTVEGWWSVPGNSCSKLGKFAKRKFYAMAKVRNDFRGWYGNDSRQCVEFPGPFERAVRPNTSCGTNGRLMGFQEFDVADDEFIWQVTGEPSWSEDEFFTFEVCNKSSRWASVAVSAREIPSSSIWMVQGWWHVAPGQCNNIGRYVRGAFYAMAEQLNSPGRWTEDDIKICVEHPGPFKRINASGYTCSYNDLVPFKRFFVTRSTEAWNLMP